MDVVKVDPASSVAPFEQVRAQIASAIETGVLSAGAKLPTVRQLAADLELAPNTVAKVFRELEMAGLIETRGRNGTFVAGAATKSGRQASRIAADFLHKMRRLGLGDAEILAILRRELAAQNTAEPQPPGR